MRRVLLGAMLGAACCWLVCYGWCLAQFWRRLVPRRWWERR